MKLVIVLACLFMAAHLEAQHSPQEIKKFRISKILKQSVTSDADNIDNFETRYDRNGNETAIYLNEEYITKSVNQYNKAGRLAKVTGYDMLGDSAEASWAVYTYNADGSYKVSALHSGHETPESMWYDKTGRLTRTLEPGIKEDIYKYDASGKLTSVKTKPGTSTGDVTDLKYSYNTKGQRSKEVSEGTYRWTRTYSYDTKGMLSKVVTVGTDEGVNTTTTDTYQYEFWK
jgi:YD repeat-containing protein